MAVFDPATCDITTRYRLLIGAIVPRPIAWITTINAAGTVNLAPFSFFNGVSAEPLTISVAIAHRDPPKDTRRNLDANGEAVVHLVPPGQLANVHQSGAEYASSISEAEVLGLVTVPSTRVRPPRLAIADIALECRLHTAIDIGETRLVILRVEFAHVSDTIAHPQTGLPDPQKLRAVARLGERSYLDPTTWTVVPQAVQQVPESMRRG